MDLIGKVENALKAEIARKSLLKYLFDKGITNIHMKINPIDIQDINIECAPLADKVEIKPHVADINPENDSATIEWDLFVLAVNRMNLGQTDHCDIINLARELDGTAIVNDTLIGSRNQITAKAFVDFVSAILETTQLKNIGYADGSKTSGSLQHTANSASTNSATFQKNQVLRQEVQR